MPGWRYSNLQTQTHPQLNRIYGGEAHSKTREQVNAELARNRFSAMVSVGSLALPELYGACTVEGADCNTVTKICEAILARLAAKVCSGESADSICERIGSLALCNRIRRPPVSAPSHYTFMANKTQLVF